MSKIWKFIVVMYLILSAQIGYQCGSQAFEDRAIENGAAYYHPQTRVFTWGKL